MKRFAVFDIDGTLIRWQLYHAAVNQLAKEGLLGQSAHQTISDARMRWKRREDPEAFRHYELELVGVFEAAVKDLRHGEFMRIAQAVIDTYRDQAYVYTRDLLRRLQAEHYTVLAISGSHHELVGLLADYYGFDDWIGSRYHRRGDRYSGAKTIAAHSKGKLLDRLVKKHGLSYRDSYGVGDSYSDRELLDKVEHPIAFNPNRQLYDYAAARGWPIVVERKNIIYRLEPDEAGQYRLMS